MERVLLAASLVIGIVVYLSRLLPAAGGAARRVAPVPDPRLRLAALLIPLLGFAVTLPSAGPLFAPGQKLGFGLLLGGAGALLSALPLVLTRKEGAVTTANTAVLFASTLGLAASTVAAGTLLLRDSLLDGLMGVAIGWLCAAFPLYLALPPARRAGLDGAHLAYGAGVAAALAAGVALGAYRDPLTPHLARLTWGGCLLAFAAFASLVTTGVILPSGGRAIGAGRVVPLAALLAAGGLALVLMATRVVGDLRIAIVGFGALLLWPVALALLRDGVVREGAERRSFAVPLLPVVLVTTGFLAAVQTLQGYGAALAVVALFAALPASFALVPGLGREPDEAGDERPLGSSAVVLLLFGAVLLLWRLFVTRWSGDLRGVTLTDQYALFGFVLGAALPALLAAFPRRWEQRRSVPLLALVVCGALVLAAPGAALMLFGAKSLVALLIGLALGVVIARGADAGPSLLAGLLAVGVALALDQFTGRVLPEGDPTRAERIRWLVGIMAVVAAGVLAADRLGGEPVAVPDSAETPQTGEEG